MNYADAFHTTASMSGLQYTGQNGRVDISQPDITTQFSMYDRIPVNGGESTYYDALVGNWSDNALSNAFFSANNIRILQNGIRAGVHRMSHGRFNVPPQNEDTLKTIMRSVYLQYAAHRTDMPVAEQVRAINALVLDYSIPVVYNEAVAYLKYRNDVSTLVVPISRPAYVSVKGDKQLELKPWF
jgi:hypothetical protein